MEKENSGKKMSIRDFINEIAIPEFKSVVGKGGGKIVFLVVILFISMIAMGIANGSLNYLYKKMNDPFVKFVDVYHKYEPRQGYQNFSLSLAESYRNKNPNQISDVFETHVTWARFFLKNPKDINDSGGHDGFVLKSNNPFYKKLKQDNFFTTTNKFHDDSWGIIISEDFAEQRNLKDDQAYINMLVMGNTLPVAICARVKSLRDNKSFILTDKLFGLLYSQKERIPEMISDSIQIYENWFIPSVSEVPQEFKELGFKKVNTNSKSTISYVNGILVNRPIKNRIIDSSFNEKILKYNAQKAYDYEKLSFGINSEENREERLGTPEMYTLLFNNQDDVLKFNEWYKKTCGFSIEESKIEAKRNFGFFNHLSTLLSWALIAFSIISIVFFVINLLLAHINKNKRNLGTLKAFGLPNKNIVSLYSSITFVLVFSSCLISYLLSSIFGQAILQAYIYIAKIDSTNYITKVVFENNDFLTTILSFVIIPTIIILIRIIKYLHKITPGDLIYGRK